MITNNILYFNTKQYSYFYSIYKIKMSKTIVNLYIQKSLIKKHK